MEVELIPADPAHNYTVFVTTPVAPALRAGVAAALMKRQDPPAEQVAFITAFEPLPCMEMMGGEFCGNASRSFGMVAAARQGLEQGSVTVNVSGCSHPLTVQVDRKAGSARVQMPLHRSVEEIPVDGQAVPVVIFDGICRAILCAPPDQALCTRVLKQLEQTLHPDAAGVIFLQSQPLFITPVVSVCATGSTVWESSCGSGSLAAALWLASQQPGEDFCRFAVGQPGGVLEVELEQKDGQVQRAWLGGPVQLGGKRTVSVEL